MNYCLHELQPGDIISCRIYVSYMMRLPEPSSYLDTRKHVWVTVSREPLKGSHLTQRVFQGRPLHIINPRLAELLVTRGRTFRLIVIRACTGSSGLVTHLSLAQEGLEG